jgi:hypothetical protein
MLKSCYAAVAGAAIALAPISAFATTITFTDSTFNSADYTESVEYTHNATLSYSFCASCGQGGVPGLQVTLNSTGSGADPGQGAIAFINTTFAYDPEVSGSVLSISASVDKILTDSIENPGAGNTFRPTIEQGGNYYLAAIPGPQIGCCGDNTTTGWNTLAKSGLQASDFEEYDFSTGSFVAAFPNFSGGPMLFGLAQTFQNPGPFSATAIYDPLQISVTSVPEPSTWAMMLFGFAGLGYAGYRRATKRCAAFVS